MPQTLQTTEIRFSGTGISGAAAPAETIARAADVTPAETIARVADAIPAAITVRAAVATPAIPATPAAAIFD